MTKIEFDFQGNHEMTLGELRRGDFFSFRGMNECFLITNIISPIIYWAWSFHQGKIVYLEKRQNDPVLYYPKVVLKLP